ncbi:hypothetical protein [Methylobacterium haplocladii]|uniref:Uncharacterized protein n=1 Tax=Methylobacterium haplocladii TaxID=1176176 RepID=A0A512IS25_9HYPH|nr:hypothetical protein [Methylobacterium haplocladii]GEP00515.1 hypothetical protein MHA02_29020 [Methylobacterium haplocladii]GJD85430.1 hypothetical protein HPGCJGGD_3319 [Methylobacterium haplocladii]GLS57815.1 hypothetical protein GCM10007887_04710 [Methylobacterium haplocladii]
MKRASSTAEQRIAALENIIRDTLWMARRYAHGRQSYAVGMYNDAARRAQHLNVQLQMTDGSIFALDGTRDGAGGAEMSALSPEEFAAAADGLNRVGITPHPDRFSPAGRKALDTLEQGGGERG